MVKTVTVPILNHEYKVVVCWGDETHLRKIMLNHYYDPKIITKEMLEEETSNRRGVTFRQHRCYPVIWINADLPFSEAIGTLSHEAVHAVDFIFEALDENLYHSEVFAHSVGAIVRETIKIMKPIDDKRKKDN